jgi:hypothetical protein
MYFDKRIFGIPSPNNQYESYFFASTNPSNLTQLISINPKYDTKICYSNINKSKAPFINGFADKNKNKVQIFNEQQSIALQMLENQEKLSKFEGNYLRMEEDSLKNDELLVDNSDRILKKTQLESFIPDLVCNKMRTKYFFKN